ncbi:MAG: carbon-nitrogen hydrolase family protein [Pseudomonadota bacterium]
MPKIAVLQMTSGIDPDANFDVIEKATHQASEAGAQILFTPEMSLLLDRKRSRASDWVDSGLPVEMIAKLSKLSKETSVDLAIGSLPIKSASSKWFNRSVYVGARHPDAVIYDKIHMFDVELSTGETWRESSAYEPGRRIVAVENTPLGQVGLTICYDLRFPALFEELGRRKCDAIAVPAAFTKPTGEAHWHILLRARAIEASAFVIAAAQVGKHEDGRETYGHSLVVDPWGEVLLDMGGEHPGLGFCDIDLGRISEVRSQFPSLANKRIIPN